MSAWFSHQLWNIKCDEVLIRQYRGQIVNSDNALLGMFSMNGCQKVQRAVSTSMYSRWRKGFATSRFCGSGCWWVHSCYEVTRLIGETLIIYTIYSARSTALILLQRILHPGTAM